MDRHAGFGMCHYDECAIPAAQQDLLDKAAQGASLRGAHAPKGSLQKSLAGLIESMSGSKNRR